MTDPTAAAQAIIQRICQDPAPQATAEDADVLSAVPAGFRDEFRVPSAHHVGQNDFIRRRVGQPRKGAGHAA